MKVDTFRDDEKSLWFHFATAAADDVFPVKIASIGHLFSSNAEYLLNTANMCRMNPFRYHSFQYLINGAGRFRYHDGNVEVEQDILPQHLFLMSHDLDFSFRFTSGDNWEWMWILVEGELPDRVVASSTGGTRVWKLDLNSAPIMSIKSLLQIVFHTQISTNQMILHGCEFLLNFKDAVFFNSLPPRDALLEKSRQIVMRNIRRINVEDFARYLGYSTKYFQKYFRNITGITPGDFILSLKLEYATMLLKNTSKKLDEIANLAGFSDASHLCRVFRSQFGISPKVWRYSTLALEDNSCCN